MPQTKRRLLQIRPTQKTRYWTKRILDIFENCLDLSTVSRKSTYNLLLWVGAGVGAHGPMTSVPDMVTGWNPVNNPFSLQAAVIRQSCLGSAIDDGHQRRRPCTRIFLHVCLEDLQERSCLIILQYLAVGVLLGMLYTDQYSRVHKLRLRKSLQRLGYSLYSSAVTHWRSTNRWSPEGDRHLPGTTFWALHRNPPGETNPLYQKYGSSKRS